MMHDRLHADGYRSFAVTGIAELVGTGPIDDHCTVLFDMMDDDAWEFVNESLHTVLPNGVALPVNAMSFKPEHHHKLTLYSNMIGVASKLSAAQQADMEPVTCAS